LLLIVVVVVVVVVEMRVGFLIVVCSVVRSVVFAHVCWRTDSQIYALRIQRKLRYSSLLCVGSTPFFLRERTNATTDTSSTLKSTTETKNTNKHELKTTTTAAGTRGPPSFLYSNKPPKTTTTTTTMDPIIFDEDRVGEAREGVCGV